MAPRHERARPHKRYGYWYLVRRVPRAFSAYDARNPVMLSTGIRVGDDPRALVAGAAVQKLDEGPGALLAREAGGAGPGCRRRYKRSLDAARRIGVPYTPVAGRAESPVERIVERFERLDGTDIEKPVEVSAVLGGEDVPPVMLSQMMDELERLSEAALVGKSERQRKRWRTPKETALATFVAAVGGDRPMSTLSRTDLLSFRQRLQDRVVAGEIAIDTANKIIGHVAVMFGAINDVNQYGLPNVFAKARLAGGKDRQRVAFDPRFVQDRILANGLFADLNAEARAIVYLVAETGLRPSEACNLDRATIQLAHDIPHVQVRPDGRQMKTDDARRDIPLVGNGSSPRAMARRTKHSLQEGVPARGPSAGPARAHQRPMRCHQSDTTSAPGFVGGFSSVGAWSCTQ